jgi:hypothetical protein
MYRHIPPLARILLISKKLAHKHLKRIAPLHKHARLPILTKHHVVFLQRTRRADTCTFFALARHIETKAALSLRIEHYEIHDGHFEHVFVHGQGEGIGARRDGEINYITVWRGAPVRRYRGVG